MTKNLQENNSSCFNAQSTLNKVRTDDIKCLEELSFADLLLSSPVLDGLKSAGFIRPSPIQVKAIPLGRFGMDLVVQAKSGTGKTCVFSVIALEAISLASSALQVLILSPTREIAFQSQQVIKTIGSKIKGLQCHTFIGGIHLSEDLRLIKECHIAVGSPGRIKYLIESGYMCTNSIRLLVLDEADMLFTDNFQPTINWIYSSLPSNKQMLTLSATYTPTMIEHLTRYMRSPTYIRLNSNDPALLGIRQFFVTVPSDNSKLAVFQAKAEILFKLLSSVEFQQCLVFSNYHSSAQDLCESLTQNGWPAAYIASSLDQAQRLKVYEKLKRFHCRILVSTDLTSRGIDAENVNLVVNMEVPWEHETYLHRIGRAGRFGAYGAAVTLVSEGAEFSLLNKIQDLCGTKILQLPDSIPSNLTRAECQLNLDDLVSTEQLVSAFAISAHITTPKYKNNSNTIRNPLDKIPHNQINRTTAPPPLANSNLESSPDLGPRAEFSQNQAIEQNRKQPDSSQEINLFVNKLWNVFDEGNVNDKQISISKMRELHSRYKIEGDSIFSPNTSISLAPPPPISIVDIPQALIDSSNIPPKPQLGFVSLDVPPPSQVEKGTTVAKNLTRTPPIITNNVSVQTHPHHSLPQDVDQSVSQDRLSQLDAEFWRLYAWANYYSEKYNELTLFIEEKKLKMELWNDCDEVEVEEEEEEDPDEG